MPRFSTPWIRLPMILKSRGFFSAASIAGAIRRRLGERAPRERRVGRRAVRAGVLHGAAAGRELAHRHVPLRRGGVQHQEPPAGAHQPHVLVVARNRAAAAFDLPAVLRVQVGLPDRDLGPVDVELVGDDLRQRRLDALSRFRVLRDDRERVVRIDGDVDVRVERGGGARTAPSTLGADAAAHRDRSSGRRPRRR